MRLPTSDNEVTNRSDIVAHLQMHEFARSSPCSGDSEARTTHSKFSRNEMCSIYVGGAYNHNEFSLIRRNNLARRLFIFFIFFVFRIVRLMKSEIYLQLLYLVRFLLPFCCRSRHCFCLHSPFPFWCASLRHSLIVATLSLFRLLY